MPSHSEHGWSRKSIEKTLEICRQKLADLEEEADRQRQYIKALEQELASL